MMKNKKTRGATLTELIICIAILATVMTIAGAALFNAFHSYALTTKIQEDEYNLRMAALSISRQIRHGVESVDEELLPEVLKLKMHDGKIITYKLTDEGILTDGGNSTVPFIEVKLSEFIADFDEDKGRIKLTLVSDRHEIKVEMTVAVDRIIRN